MPLLLEMHERGGLTKAVLKQWVFLTIPLCHAYVRAAFGESLPFASALIFQEPELIVFLWRLDKENEGNHVQLRFSHIN